MSNITMHVLIYHPWTKQTHAQPNDTITFCSWKIHILHYYQPSKKCYMFFKDLVAHILKSAASQVYIASNCLLILLYCDKKKKKLFSLYYIYVLLHLICIKNQGLLFHTDISLKYLCPSLTYKILPGENPAIPCSYFLY